MRPIALVSPLLHGWKSHGSGIVCWLFFFKKSAKVSLSAAAVGNGGESKQQSSPTHQPTTQAAGKPPRFERRLPKGANNLKPPTLPLHGAYLRGTPHRIARRCLDVWRYPTRSGPGGGAGFWAGGQVACGLFWVLGFRLHAGVRACVAWSLPPPKPPV